MHEHKAPRLQQISRRRFVKWIGAGAAVAAASAAGTLTVLHGRSDESPDGSAIPVQNPAFRSVAGDGEGHFVLFCQTGTEAANDFVAFDLNAAAWAVWNLCASWESVCSDSARSVGEIAATLAERLARAEVTQFVSLMHEKGLIYFADSKSTVYWEYESSR